MLALLSVAMFVGLVVLSIAIAGWLHIGCPCTMVKQ